MDRERVLVALNLGVGLWYVVLAFSATGFLMVAFQHNGRRKVDVSPWVMPAMVVGAALFLAGCGIHHWHLAEETIPRSVDLLGDRSPWLAGSAYTHHVLLGVAQNVGAPMFLLSGEAVRRAYTKAGRARRVQTATE